MGYEVTWKNWGGVRAFGPCHINPQTEIGDNTAVNNLQVIGHGDCLIGKHCHLGWGLTIITSNHNWRGNGIPYDDKNIMKAVHIEDFVWIGANVTILPGVTIGEGAIIQAGSVVRKDIPSMALAGGNPAEIFSWRDKEHFERMKSEGRFF